MASSSSSSTNTGQVYDVFLNHRGPDTKKGLASHIYHRLIDRGLRVFLDHLEFRKGEDMRSQINEAIRTASVHVAIFSPTYAQSSWCLDELALMVESGSTIFPVFYNVDPSEVRWTQSGDLGEKGRYARDLQGLENKTTLDPRTNKKKPRYDSSTLKKWRDALRRVSFKSGYEMKEYSDDEGWLVDDVVKEVSRKASKTAPSERLTREQLAPSERLTREQLAPSERLSGAADGPPGTLLARVLQPAGAPRLGGAADGPPSSMFEQLPPSLRELLAPSLREQLPPSLRELLPPSPREQLAPSLRELLPPSPREQLAPSLRGQLPPIPRARQQLAPSLRGQLPPIPRPREQLAPSLRGQLPPIPRPREQLAPSLREQFPPSLRPLLAQLQVNDSRASN